MSEIGKNMEISMNDISFFKNIKPEGKLSLNECYDYFDNEFEKKFFNLKDNNETDNPDHMLEKTKNEYIDDLKANSECPETIPDNPFDCSDLKKMQPEEVAERREEFDDKKAQLKKEWEEKNGRPWSKYEHDVYSSNGKLIRKAGSDYDAHHIQPLGMGGKNEASNITPMNAEVHYDKQGVHAPDSPYSKLDKMLGGM